MAGLAAVVDVVVEVALDGLSLQLATAPTPPIWMDRTPSWLQGYLAP